MSGKYVRAVMAGFAVAFVISGGLGLLSGLTGRPFGLSQALPGMTFGAITAYLLANLAGNRRTAAAEGDVLEAARAMRPPPGKALVYAYREGFVGMAAGLNVKLDGVELAQLTSPRFTCLAVEPGPHTLSGAFGGLAGAQNRPASAEFAAGSGEVRAFRFGVNMGALKNGVKVEPITDLTAVKVRLSRMKMTRPDGPALF